MSTFRLNKLVKFLNNSIFLVQKNQLSAVFFLISEVNSNSKFFFFRLILMQCVQPFLNNKN